MASKVLLDMIKEAMKDEKHDHKKYHMMMEMTCNPIIRNQIRFAYLDEGIHYKMFRQIYFELTGMHINIPTPPVRLLPTLKMNVRTSINGELDAVELYRKIYAMLTSRSQRDRLFRIITDEQEHATRFVYVFSMLNK